jgi:4-hydroxy-tetrahydrodipicolinate synthase
MQKPTAGPIDASGRQRQAQGKDMAATLRGTFTVMITPTRPDGSYDAAALAEFTDWQIREGIHGLVPLGSTGEFLSFSREERAEIARIVIDTAARRVPVLIGTGAEDTREVVRLSREAEALGADGVMVIPPFYSTPSADELFAHYDAIASAIGIPVMIYNNPATSNVDIKPPLVARLAEIDGCRYIKESTLEVTRVRDIIRLCGDRMGVFGGILGFESFVEGAVGWIAVASNVAPRPLARLFELVAEDKIREAHALYLKWLPIIETVGGARYVTATKAILAHMGFAAGKPLPPRLPLADWDDAAMGRLVAELGLSFAGRTARAAGA